MYKFMVSQGTDPETYTADNSLSEKQEVHACWELVSCIKNDNQQYVYVYAYAKNNNLIPLKKGEITEPLFDKLQLWNFSEREYNSNKDHSVRVEALGIQTDLPNLTADNISEIWEIAKGGGGE